MSLDPFTLGLVLVLVYLGNALLSGLMAWSGRAFPGAWLWVGAQALMSLGAVAQFVGPWCPLWVSGVAGNSVLVSSLLLYCHAIWSFRFADPFPPAAYGLLAVIPMSFWAVAGLGPGAQTMVYSFWTALGAGIGGYLLLWRFARPYRLATSLTALPLLVTSAASVVRLVANGLFPGTQTVFGAPWVNSLYLLGTVLLSTVTLFGYFMMTGIRSEQELGRKDEEIRAQNRKLIESGRAKDLFFSIIAHDLRGPIGGSARYVRKHLLGKMTGLETKFAEVETLASALEKTNEFLEKLLWWSRAQLQDWVPSRVPLDLAVVIDQVFSLNRSVADWKEISLHADPAPYPRPWADPESVQIILGNFVSNAVKFSLPGRKINVQVSDDDPVCRITVVDEGVGMDASTLDRLFRIEDKLTTHGTSGERGSGLGLLLCRSLAERNQGGIQIVSEPGVGTRATLWLPKE